MDIGALACVVDCAGQWRDRTRRDGFDWDSERAWMIPCQCGVRGGAEVCLGFSGFTMYRIRASYVNFVLLLKKLPIIRGVLVLRKLPITRDVLDLMFCC